MPLSHHLSIGFLTCALHRDLTADDLILARALERRGSKIVPVVWTETPPESLSCDLLVLRSVWDYHLHPDKFVHWLTAAVRRTKVVNAPEIVRWNMDKHYLKDIAAAGFAVPKTVFLERGSQADLQELMRSTGLTSAVIKPAISASAFETYRIEAAQAADFSPKLNTLLRDRSMMVQEFIPEIATGGEWSLIFIGNGQGGHECTHAVNKLPRPGDFRVQEEHGGLHALASPPAAAVHMAQAILARFAPETAYCRADIVMRGGTPTLMELELIEPLLHFELAPQAAEKMADGLLCILRGDKE
ncbi:MAG: hypothetical protein LAO20_18335 [Acidobacteriia bacterium]|nr:hypothetical protein [Terriglobia bacterium]